jgi:hypothetical protein
VRVAFSVSRIVVRRSSIVTYYLVSSVVLRCVHDARESLAVVVWLYVKFDEGELVAVSRCDSVLSPLETLCLF